jgi:integrase/recombinase XerD
MTSKEKILTQHQLDLIQNELISKHHKIMFAIARYTGQKFKYICNLKVSDVYNEDKFPRAEARFSGELLGVHYAVICTKLTELLIAYSPRNFSYDQLLFPSPIARDKTLSINSVDKFLRCATRRAGLEDLNVSTSSIRKAFVKSLYENGIDKNVIKEMIGIKKDSELLVYSESESRDYKKILDNFLI